MPSSCELWGPLSASQTRQSPIGRCSAGCAGFSLLQGLLQAALAGHCWLSRSHAGLCGLANAQQPAEEGRLTSTTSLAVPYTLPDVSTAALHTADFTVVWGTGEALTLTESPCVRCLACVLLAARDNSRVPATRSLSCICETARRHMDEPECFPCCKLFRRAAAFAGVHAYLAERTVG